MKSKKNRELLLLHTLTDFHLVSFKIDADRSQFVIITVMDIKDNHKFKTVEISLSKILDDV